MRGRRQFNLSLLGGLTDTLNGHAVSFQVGTSLLLKLAQDVLDKGNIKIFTTKMGITVGGFDLEDTLLHLQDRDIESTSSQIVDGNDGVVYTIKTVCKRGSGRLVNDTKDIKTGNLASILGSLTLGIVEVGGDRDDGMATN